MRIAFVHAPNEAKILMKKIDHEDNRISDLIKELSEYVQLPEDEVVLEGTDSEMDEAVGEIGS